MRRLRKWLIFYELSTRKKKSCILYDTAPNGSTKYNNQVSIQKK